MKIRIPFPLRILLLSLPRIKYELIRIKVGVIGISLPVLVARIFTLFLGFFMLNTEGWNLFWVFVGVVTLLGTLCVIIYNILDLLKMYSHRPVVMQCYRCIWREVWRATLFHSIVLLSIHYIYAVGIYFFGVPKNVLEIRGLIMALLTSAFSACLIRLVALLCVNGGHLGISVLGHIIMRRFPSPLLKLEQALDTFMDSYINFGFPPVLPGGVTLFMVKLYASLEAARISYFNSNNNNDNDDGGDNIQMNMDDNVDNVQQLLLPVDTCQEIKRVGIGGIVILLQLLVLNCLIWFVTFIFSSDTDCLLVVNILDIEGCSFLMKFLGLITTSMLIIAVGFYNIWDFLVILQSSSLEEIGSITWTNFRKTALCYIGFMIATAVPIHLGWDNVGLQKDVATALLIALIFSGLTRIWALLVVCSIHRGCIVVRPMIRNSLQNNQNLQLKVEGSIDRFIDSYQNNVPQIMLLPPGVSVFVYKLGIAFKVGFDYFFGIIPQPQVIPAAIGA